MSRIISIIIGTLIIAASFYFGYLGNEKSIEKIQKELKEYSMSYNQLAREKSPYLLQHKDNPVHWYAWGEEAFQAARNQKKPIFLSIGYSTCHWCHVMEKDSFETEAVAKVLNENFISIKVDREERPDVDQAYMDAVVALSGHGGWPMSVFLTPDLKPFFGGTFYWRDQFIELLTNIARLWKTDPRKIIESGEDLTKHLQSGMEGRPSSHLDESHLRTVVDFLKQGFDQVHGGFGRAPKFPRSYDLSLLMRLYLRERDPQILNMVTKTLDAMARGGIYDHLGGGFSRYATDAQWLVPHFEKMLYDNALLAYTYAEAYQLTQDPVWKTIVQETLDYVLRDMTSPEGGFYSAEDADSEGHEGKFYVWSYEELEKVLLPDEMALVERVFGVSERGNFERQTNILHLPVHATWGDRQEDRIRRVRQKLFALREKRVHPLKDRKIITEWNALMIAAMTKGYQVLDDERYLKAAQGAADFLLSRLCQDDSLKRRYCDGEARFEGVANDYAYMIRALLELYEADFDARWIHWAQRLDKKQEELFWDEEEGGYYFSPKNLQDLFRRKKEFNDGATPSANGVNALNHLKLYALTQEESHRRKAEKILSLVSKYIHRYPPGFSSSLMALDFMTGDAKEVAVLIRPGAEEGRFLREFLRGTFLPHQVVAVSGTENDEVSLLKGKRLEGDFIAYVCRNHVCEKPVTDLRLLKEALIRA